MPLLSVSTSPPITREGDSQHNQREQEAEAPFWQFDEEIGEGRFFDEQHTVRLKAHISPERYCHTSPLDEIIPLDTKKGTRIYVMAKPYILEQDYRLSIGLYPQPTEQGAIGEVTQADWEGMRGREVGHCQAWLYPEERTLILWECLIEHWYRGQDPRTDETLRTVWLGFEGFLLKHLPAVERIATPGWEPIYEDDRDAWPQFLEMVGYKRIDKMAFGKDVPDTSDEARPTP